MHLEEPLHLVDDAVEVPGLEAGRRLMGVAVHRIALPDDLVAGRLDGADDGRQHVADLAVTHPRDEREAPRHVVRIETLDVFDSLLRRRRGPDLDADRIADELRERDVGAVELAGPLPDPQEVRREVVEDLPGTLGVVGQPQHGALVVEDERFVRGEDGGGVQIRIGDAAGVHEPQAAIDLGRQGLVACAGR